MPRHAAAFTTKGGAPKGSSLKYLGRLEVEVLANDALVAGQETAAENNGVVLLPERVVFTAENVADYNF